MSVGDEYRWPLNTATLDNDRELRLFLMVRDGYSYLVAQVVHKDRPISEITLQVREMPAVMEALNKALAMAKDHERYEDDGQI